MRDRIRQRWIKELFWLIVTLWSRSLGAQSTGLPSPELITDQQGLPQGFVRSIVQDRQDFIWMATQDGLCRYDGYHFKIFRAQPGDSLSLPFSSVSALLLDHLGRIWITFEQNEVVLFNPRTETFTNITRQFLNRPPFPLGGVRQYYPDRQNRLWLALDEQGLVCVDLTTRRCRWFRHRASEPHSLGSDHVRCVLQDQQGIIWIGTTDAGLERFDEKTGRFVHYRPDSPTPLALPELPVFGLYQRPSGELLLALHHYVCRFNPRTAQLRAYPLPVENKPAGSEYHLYGMHFSTDRRGVVYCDQRDRLFRFTDRDGLQLLARLTPQTGFCASLSVDRSDVLWIGTDGSGVRKYDLRADGFRNARYQTGFQTDLLTNWLHVPAALVESVRGMNPYLFRYTLDRQGTIWVNVGSSTFYRINPVTGQTQRVDFPISFAQTTSPLATDERGRVWVLYLNNLWYYDPAQGQWVRSTYRIEEGRTGEVLQMVVDKDAFWLASQGRGLFQLDRRTGTIRQYSHQTNQSTSLSNNNLYCLSADPVDPNRLWIGTFGGGLCAFGKRSGQCRRITEQNGLPNDVIYSAIPDRNGNLWIGTNKGLCRMNRKTFQTRTFTTKDGLLANEFNRFHYIRLPSDQIIMGGVKGLTGFQPTQLKDDAFQPKVELTELQINNRVLEAKALSLLSQPIQAVDQLNLSYNQNFLTVSFAALQYNRPGTNRYRYRLKGIDDEWVETIQPQAIYTALAPNRYTLLINAANTSGRWSPYVRRLAITIQPPVWSTWWAYVLYTLVVAGNIWYGLRLYLSRLQLQQAVLLQQQQVELSRKEIQIKQQEAQQLRALDEMKTRFFSNVTHDFRTPLTLILSPMSGLMEDLADTRYAKRLESIRRNAGQLLTLINQLLDFAKLEAKALSIQEARGDVGQFVGQTVGLFEEEAHAKAVQLSYHTTVAGEYWFDADKLERILANLLGNALKFTPSGGQISVWLREAQGIQLTVSDSGVGIAADKLPFIFDRFFQGSANAWSATAVEEANEPTPGQPTQPLPPVGTGIGLALVKELVELQGGRVEVASPAGGGTTFLLTLPYQWAGAGINQPEPISQRPAFSPPILPSQSDGEPPHLLLVEDNPELAEFVADSLPGHYRISRAANGAEGLNLAFGELPDLVISDVMMPVMDGYTFCQQLKADERTSHIPLILLTAKVTLDNRLEGLGLGADDYLTKPFHVPELNLRIYNLLERQRRLRERIRQELAKPELEPAASSQFNHAIPNHFLEKLHSIIEEKLDDPSLTVEELAERLNLSRSVLHRKVKALTGLATSDLIRIYRLKRATHLLRQGYNSSETAYQVGFDSPQYFARCFREQYQMTPSEFARQG